ncbi:MAG: phosphopantetheine-binding protein, partial [Pikeienuella sp.]
DRGGARAAPKRPLSDEPPRGATEITLAGIWREVLGVERPGRHDGFFDLGGDSVMAIQVAARAAEAGLAIEPRDLFARPTVAALAAAARPAPTPAMAELPALDDIDLDAVAELVSFDEE